MHAYPVANGIGKTAALTVGAVTPVAIQAAAPNTSAQMARSDRKNIYIFNNGAAPLYLDFVASVTAATAGIVVPAGSAFSADYGERLQLFGISGAGNLDVRVTEVY